uniref:Ig-like domain-containing protein n=1 Tax=Salarias fasciatus TaxID=181472 RepID=A0A672F378_SALFA
MIIILIIMVVMVLITVIDMLVWSQIFQGEEITLTCEVQGGEKTDWWYDWRRNSESLQQKNEKILKVAASQSINEEYGCMATRRDDFDSSTRWSKAFTVSVLLTNKPVITRQPSWSQIFQGEEITLTCEVQGGEKTDWWYYWRRNSQYLQQKNEKFLKVTASQSLNEEYDCMATRRDDSYSSTTWSEAFTVLYTVDIRVTLTCSVNQPAGWKYFWYRDSKTSLLNTHDTDEYQSQSEVSQEGRYWCRGGRGGRGGRGDPLYYTEYSDPISVTKISEEDFLKPQLYQGETIALRCAIDGGNTGWEYEWETSSLLKPANVSQYRMEALSSQHQGEYRCKGNKLRGAQSTDWSNTVTLRVFSVHPSASLTVNPDRVQHFTSESLSLTCEGSSSQWRLIRFLTDDSLLSFLPPATINGSTYIKNEAPRKAVYWCESGTEFSNAVNISTHSDGVILVSPVYPVPVGESVTLLCVMKTRNIPSDVFFYKNNKLIENERRGEMKISAVSESDEGFYKCQYNGRESAQSWMAVQCKSSAHFYLFSNIHLFRRSRFINNEGNS